MKFRPFFPPRESELTQAYFARTGRLHALADVNTFLRYTGLDPEEFRIGSDAFIDRVAELTGADRTLLARSTLKSHGNTRSPRDGTMTLHGQPLSARLVRRNVVKVCPVCLLEDQGTDEPAGPGQWALRTHWLFQPVVVCPVHHVPLVPVKTGGGVLAFDLAQAFMRTGFDPRRWRDDGIRRPPGGLQTYVLDRLRGAAAAFPWLDDQTLSQAVRSCEMIGSLVGDGPEPNIGAYDEADRARVGDIGFAIAAHGHAAILAELTRIRMTSGRTSGRAGPQAVFGQMYRWLTRSDLRAEAGPITDVLREAIVRNFPVGPGDMVLGAPVEKRLVHSANSLASRTRASRKRLYRQLEKVGLIPGDVDGVALNQHVFPADEAERILERIENAVPLKELHHVLGCSKMTAARLAVTEMVASVVPMQPKESVGLTMGTFNRDDLCKLLDAAWHRATPADNPPEGYLPFARACRRCTSVALVSWQRDGHFHGTATSTGR